MPPCTLHSLGQGLGLAFGSAAAQAPVSAEAGGKRPCCSVAANALGKCQFWQIDGEKVETVADFIFLGSKITADPDYSL